MKVFAENLIKDYAISRIERALKQYAPAGIEFVTDENQSDFSIIYAFGQRRKIWWHADRLIHNKKRYAVVQTAIRSTTNPCTKDWENIWRSAELVWSYYNIQKMLYDDDETDKYLDNFYYAPLGVDSNLFMEVDIHKKYVVASGIHRMECGKEIIQAATAVSKLVNTAINLKDEEMPKFYSECQYVSGLRRIEGFEMPIIEGLLCGARPIAFNQEHYRKWFGDHALYIPESTNKQEIVNSLIEIFKKDPVPVTLEEKKEIASKFDWQPIISEFWKRIKYV